MPYIIIRGNLGSYDNKYPWRVLVSGLRTQDIESLAKYPCGGYCDECTIVYLRHPCVILSALEALGYQIVASSSTSVKQDYNEYMWTMRRYCDLESDNTSQTTFIAALALRVLNCDCCIVLKSPISNMSHAHCCKNKANSNLAQTLDEMQFERGIWSAACDNEIAKVEKFLNTGTSPNVKDAAGYTALHYASSRGHVDICKMLLKSGADINAETRAGQATALHRAASGGKKSIVECLLQNGCDILKQDADGRTALHRAIINRHYDIAEILSTVCPDVSSIRDNKNKLPLDYDEK